MTEKTITYKTGDVERIASNPNLEPYVNNVDTSDVIITVDSEDAVTLLGQCFTSSGYEIASWNTAWDGSGTTYELLGQYTGTEDLTLYAQWQLSNAGKLTIINKVNGAEQAIDVSNLMYGMTVYYGKNQPFAYVILTVSKQLVNDKVYWNGRMAHDLYGTYYTTPPAMDQSQTIFRLNLYSIEGDWLYERVEDDGEQLYKITCVCPAYKLKTTTLQTAFNFKYDDGTYRFYNIPDVYDVEVTAISNTRDCVSFKNDDNFTNQSGVVLYIDHSQTPYIERVVADGGDLFKMLSNIVGGYDLSTQMCVDDGYMYDISNADYEIADAYSSSQIEALKSANHITLTGDGNDHRADLVSIRVDEYCWDTIMSLGYLSNRTPFFYDKAYFADYQTSGSNYDDAKNLRIDWGGDDGEHEYDGELYTTPGICSLSANLDQGSEYLLSSQKVISEAYEFEITISDAPTTASGKDVKYLYHEDVTLNNSGDYVFNTTTRRFQTKLIALNILATWYKPGDSIQYDIMEAIHTSRTISQYPLPTTALYDGEIIEYFDSDSLMSVYYEATIVDAQMTANWTRVTDAELDTQRYYDYSPYTIANEVYDVQNNIALTDVPLAQTVIYYPSKVTQYTWGIPEFVDEESNLSQLKLTAQDTTLDNTADMTISNNYAAKLVIGNQTLAELADDRAGFKGLIMEKNWDAELYRLAGYGPDGSGNTVLQSYISSDGKVMAGNGSVMIYSGGIVTGYGGSQTKVITNTNSISYDSNKAYRIGDIYFDPSVGKLKIYMG